MSARKPDAAGEAAVLEGLKSSVVLMVDDEPTTLDVIEMFLHAEGYREVVKVTDPRKALATIGAVQPDVVLLNLMMPHVSGLEILAALGEDPAVQSIPTIIITGSSDAELKRKALGLGAADFLGKPVDPSELALRLRNTLASRAYREGETPRRATGGSSEAIDGAPGERPDRIRTIVDTFLSRLHPRLDAIGPNLESGDFDAVIEMAHWLKGAAGTVGLHQFTAPAETLDRLARRGAGEEMQPVVEQLQQLADEAGSGEKG